ncbi:hypothetical protein BDZ45DRAFT_747589 [Acephala macrosclerotiorum]|nr:hypothetical protein BDZ45DRAFT_747589 [Acephala macrosclerotiorum]
MKVVAALTQTLNIAYTFKSCKIFNPKLKMPLVEKLEVRPASAAQIVLHQISFQAIKGSRTMILGPVAVESYLVQVDRFEYLLHGWHTAASPRGSQTTYGTISHGCVLEDDISQLPHSDSTVIRSRGLALSGGQKQRISILCTTKYNLIGRSFRALDTKTEEILFSRVFGKHRILCRWNPAIVIATHSAQPDFKVLEAGTPGIKALAIAPKPVVQPTEVQLEGLARRAGDFSVYSYYLRSIGWWYSIAAVDTILVYTFSINFPQIWLMWCSEHQNKSPAQFIGVYLFPVAVTALSQEAILPSLLCTALAQSHARSFGDCNSGGRYSTLHVSPYLQSMITSWTNMETSLGAIARTKAFEADTIPEDQPGEGFSPPANWPEKGLVEISGVTAAYKGKSSLLYVILRVLDMNEGTIFIGGIDIRTIPRNVLRSHLIAILQDPFVIAGTVRLNVDPLTTVSNDTTIVSVLRKVRLWEDWMEISVLNLRRKEIICEEFGGYTVFTVAHRIGTLKHSDKVAILERGELMKFDLAERVLEMGPGGGEGLISLLEMIKLEHRSDKE